MLRRARRLNLRCRPIFISFAVILVRVTDCHSFGVLVVIGLLPHLYGLARQACFIIGKEPSVNKANDPPEQKVKAADQASLRRHSGYPDKAFSSFLGVTS